MEDLLRESAEPPRPTITHDEAIRYPGLRRLYRDERLALAKAGEAVWILRGLDGSYKEMVSGEELALEYYQGGELRGFVEGNDLDGFDVYGPPLEAGQLHHLNSEPVTLLSEAQKSLANYIKDTSSI